MVITVIGSIQKMEYFAAKLLPLNNKAKELGFPEISFKKVGVIYRQYYDTKEHKYIQYQELVYILEGDVPRLDGYEYLGKVEHFHDAGNIIWNMVDDVNLESFRHERGVCTHCKTDRFRKFTHILQKEGELVQVGSNCLADFLRGNDYLKSLEYFFDIVREAKDEEFDSFGRFRRTFIPSILIRDVARYMLSTNMALNQKLTNLIENYLRYQYGLLSFSGPFAKEEYYKFMEESEPLLRKVSEENVDLLVEQVEQFLASKSSNFTHNLYILRQEKELPIKRLKLGMWMVLSFFKAQETEKQRAEKQRIAEEIRAKELREAIHIGVVGESLTFKGLVTKKMVNQGNWGNWYLLLLKDMESGATVILKGTSQSVYEMEQGEVYLITAKVKAHDNFNGKKQTVIQRVKEFKKVENV